MTNAEERPVESDLGGDPVCWAHLLCPECGRLGSGGDEQCQQCGAELPE